MLTALLVLSLAASPTAQAAAPATPAPSLATIMRQPERVQIFLANANYLPSKQKPTKKDKRPRVRGFIFTKEGPALKGEEQQSLARTWESPEEEAYREPKRCAFNPDIALRFSHGGTWVDAVVCFGCRDIWFFDAKGEPTTGGYFKDFALLRKLAVAAFPKEQFRE
jgi:hypothetical protein